MSNQTAKQRRTLIKVAVKKTEYAAGSTAKTDYEIVKAQIGITEPDGAPVYTDCFYCEWRNSFGSAALQSEQENIKGLARVRMTFVQSVYDALNAKGVRIYKGGRTDPANTFTVATLPDDYMDKKQMLEFQVKRIEGK